MSDSSATGNDAVEDWQDTLLSVLRRMDPAAFERLAQRLLRESGFVQVEVTGRSGDGGIDGTGILRLSLMSFHVLFQCKRYQGRSEEHTSELQSLMRISYAVFCLKKKNIKTSHTLNYNSSQHRTLTT